MTDPFFAAIEGWNGYMRILVVPLSICGFFIGRRLGQNNRRKKVEQLSVAEIANHYYAKGYNAASSERDSTRSGVPAKLEVVGGKDTRGRA